MGKSRSATCVFAYLIQKYDITPQQALERVRQSRPLVEPNDGFMQQLEMYYRMRAPINVEESPIYQRWMYQREVQLSSDCGQAPDAEKIRFEDEHIDETDNINGDSELKCKKCRYVKSFLLYVIPMPWNTHVRLQTGECLQLLNS
jgi:dual specificity phosphatase 12